MAFKLSAKDFHPTVAKWYTEYLLSSKWIDFKGKIFGERGERCEECGSLHLLSLHHKTYARLFNEDPLDVKILCQDCHHAAHKSFDIPYLFLIYNPNIKEVKYTLKESRYAAKILIETKRTKKQKENTTTWDSNSQKKI